MKVQSLQEFLIAQDCSGDLHKLIVLILSVYNCRINEILKATWQNFYPNKYLILEGSKGSANIIIHDREILKHISKIPRLSSKYIFPFISYYQIYHYIKKNYSHLLTDIKHKKNLKITHSFRYINVAGLDNDKFIKDILHHNSTRSGKYYKNKLKGS